MESLIIKINVQLPQVIRKMKVAPGQTAMGTVFPIKKTNVQTKKEQPPIKDVQINQLT
jgi:hypothetical protein